MTWQLASFGILAFGIAAGFAWYERSRPSARIGSSSSCGSAEKTRGSRTSRS